MSYKRSNNNDMLTAGFVFLMMMIGLVLMLVIGSVIKAVVLTYLWQWFVVSHFGVAPLTIGSAIGLSLTVSMFTAPPQSQSSDDFTALTGRLIGTLVGAPLLVLFLGWIVKFYV